MQTLNVETIKLIGNGVLDAKHVAVLLQADMLEQEAALARKQAELTAERRLAVAKLISKHPYLRFDVKRTLKVKR